MNFKEKQHLRKILDCGCPIYVVGGNWMQLFWGVLLSDSYKVKYNQYEQVNRHEQARDNLQGKW